MLFLAMLAFNLLVMALDFPRFTLVAVLLGILFVLFFLLWFGAYFEFDLMQADPRDHLAASTPWPTGLLLMVFVTLCSSSLIIYVTRWLDYWEILPNEILHHHGPLSDLERYPTMNLKFDKEIPDVFEYLLLGRGPAGAARPQRVQGDRAGQRAVHQPQGKGAEAGDEPDGGPGHDRPGSRRSGALRPSTIRSARGEAAVAAASDRRCRDAPARRRRGCRIEREMGPQQRLDRGIRRGRAAGHTWPAAAQLLQDRAVQCSPRYRGAGGRCRPRRARDGRRSA